MAIITIYLKKKELKDIASGKIKEYNREITPDTLEQFCELPESFVFDGKTDDEIADAYELKTDIEAINFQCGRNQSDGYALVELKELETDEYEDEAGKLCGIYYFALSLGRVLKTNLE